MTIMIDHSTSMKFFSTPLKKNKEFGCPVPVTPEEVNNQQSQKSFSDDSLPEDSQGVIAKLFDEQQGIIDALTIQVKCLREREKLHLSEINRLKSENTQGLSKNESNEYHTLMEDKDLLKERFNELSIQYGESQETIKKLHYCLRLQTTTLEQIQKEKDTALKELEKLNSRLELTIETNNAMEKRLRSLQDMTEAESDCSFNTLLNSFEFTLREKQQQIDQVMVLLKSKEARIEKLRRKLKKDLNENPNVELRNKSINTKTLSGSSSAKKPLRNIINTM